MAEKKTAADGRKRKGQKTRAELIKDNDALQMILSEQAEEIESLKASREAWVRKCEELTGQLEETMKERAYYERRAQEAYSFYHEADDENKLLRNHPWKNLWRHIKEALGLA